MGVQKERINGGEFLEESLNRGYRVYGESYEVLGMSPVLGESF